jgi:hypothetical protein
MIEWITQWMKYISKLNQFFFQWTYMSSKLNQAKDQFISSPCVNPLILIMGCNFKTTH